MKYTCRSRAPGQGGCLKGISRTITMQDFILACITDAEKKTWTKIITKSMDREI